MSRDTVNAICASLPGAEVSDPWGGGHDCWKVGGKSFAIMGSASPGVAIRTDSAETAEMLIEAGAAWRDKYLRGAWVKMSWDAADEELRERILASYRLIRAGLTKKVQATLGDIQA